MRLVIYALVRFSADDSEGGLDMTSTHLLSGTGSRVQTATFPRRLESPSRARQFVINAAGRHPAVDDAVLLTSEMVTNSLLHAREAATVTVTVAVNIAFIRVEVCDDSRAGFPRLLCGREADGEAEDGRGFQLVNGLARRWGFMRDEERTCCWFEVTAPDRYGE
jgi:anti-sigma regulatory factor (Ser/Thr protein kinase)